MTFVGGLLLLVEEFQRTRNSRPATTVRERHLTSALGVACSFAMNVFGKGLNACAKYFGTPAVIEAFRRVVESECTENMKWGTQKEVPETKVRLVLGSQQRQRRILRSRFKNRGLRDSKARCRMCVSGSADPDLPLLVRDALGLGRKPITPLRPLSHPTSPG